MKKLLLFSLTVLASASFSNAQETADIFKASDYKYVYYGIDYSHAKFMGDFSQFADAGTKSMPKIKSIYFEGWNNVVKKERDKYDLSGALRKERIHYKINVSEKINEGTAVEDMEADFADELSESDIQGYVSAYDLPDSSGVGIIFITEYLDKNEAEAAMHFVVFNISNKQVMLHERYVESAAGFGLRNYWIRPFYNAINSISKDFKGWKSEQED